MVEEPRDNVWKMFDRIAPRYDVLNRLLSLGHDIRWRSRVSRHIAAHQVVRILDIATGTADQLISAVNRHPGLQLGAGVDMSGNMLEYAHRKISRRRLTDRLSLIRGDALLLPFADQSFDLTSIVFGIRNVMDASTALQEMYRVLTPQGRVVILEFSIPYTFWFRKIYLLYLRHILPVIGSFISGDDHAYRYLNRTVESFPYGENFCKLVRSAGFKDVQAESLTFGIATIYHGMKV